MKFVVYAVKEADIGNEVFEDSKVGDLIVFSFEGEGEDTKVVKYPSLQGHRVTASEAGTGAFVNAKEGDLGVLKDDVFLTEAQLTEALSSKQELTELSDDDLENIAGGGSMQLLFKDIATDGFVLHWSHTDYIISTLDIRRN